MEGKVKEGVETLEKVARRDGGFANFFNLTIALFKCGWKSRAVEMWLGYRGMGRAWKEGKRGALEKGKEEAMNSFIMEGEGEEKMVKITAKMDCIICALGMRLLRQKSGSKW